AATPRCVRAPTRPSGGAPARGRPHNRATANPGTPPAPRAGRGAGAASPARRGTPGCGTRRSRCAREVARPDTRSPRPAHEAPWGTRTAKARSRPATGGRPAGPWTPAASTVHAAARRRGSRRVGFAAEDVLAVAHAPDREHVLADMAEAVPTVEALRPHVLRPHPQPQRARPVAQQPVHRRVAQPRAQALALEALPHVQPLDLAVARRDVRMRQSARPRRR